jgi:hypothetical protein
MGTLVHCHHIEQRMHFSRCQDSEYTRTVAGLPKQRQNNPPTQSEMSVLENRKKPQNGDTLSGEFAVIVKYVESGAIWTQSVCSPPPASNTSSTVTGR